MTPFKKMDLCGTERWNWMRIGEALIIAVLTAVATSYVTVAKMDVRVCGLEKAVDRIETLIMTERLK